MTSCCYLTDTIISTHQYHVQHFNAKLSDFGLAKHGPDGGESHVTTRVMGTYGYAAPEYVSTGMCQGFSPPICLSFYPLWLTICVSSIRKHDFFIELNVNWSHLSWTRPPVCEEWCVWLWCQFSRDNHCTTCYDRNPLACLCKYTLDVCKIVTLACNSASRQYLLVCTSATVKTPSLR